MNSPDIRANLVYRIAPAQGASANDGVVGAELIFVPPRAYEMGMVTRHIFDVAALVAMSGYEAGHLDVVVDTAAGDLRADLFEQGLAIVGLEAAEAVPDVVSKARVHGCDPCAV